MERQEGRMAGSGGLFPRPVEKQRVSWAEEGGGLTADAGRAHARTGENRRDFSESSAPAESCRCGGEIARRQIPFQKRMVIMNLEFSAHIYIFDGNWQKIGVKRDGDGFLYFCTILHENGRNRGCLPMTRDDLYVAKCTNQPKITSRNRVLSGQYYHSKNAWLLCNGFVLLLP